MILYLLLLVRLLLATAEPFHSFDNWHRRDATALSAPASGNTAPASVGSFSDVGDIEPTNSTSGLDNTLSLSIIGNLSSLRITTDVAALTAITGRSIIKNGNNEGICVGSLILAEKNKVISWPNIAMISCDNETETMELVLQAASQNSACMLLYSLNSAACTLPNSKKFYPSQLGFVMTFLSVPTAQSVVSNVRANEEGDFTGVLNVMPTATPAPTGGKTSSGSTLAMAILYAITGVVAFLFLFVIVSGAIRVHNYPERYGLPPAGGYRNDEDNAQYSNMHRAKGIARAVLDSIPLVTVRVKPKTTQFVKEVEPISESTVGLEKSDGIELEINPAEPEALKQRPLSIPLVIEDDDDKSTCPICFEDFQDGQVLRILPCKHRFHALCVDPWLLNSSSHCPLCRVDLSISQEETVPEHPPGSPTTGNSNRQIVIPEGYQVDTSRFTRFLDVWNAHLLPRDARRVALARFEEEAELRRQLREQRSGGAEGCGNGGSGSSSRLPTGPLPSTSGEALPTTAAAASSVGTTPFEHDQQQQNLWLRFVASRRRIHQLRRSSMVHAQTESSERAAEQPKT